TSTYWRFEMISGVVLLLVMLPLSYWLTIEMGIRGTALAQLISISIYNMIRILFLWKKFRLFPFNRHTLSVLGLAGGCFAICFFGFQQLHGWTGIIVRSIVFMAIYATAVILFRFSPDVDAVIKAIKGRLGFGKS
ncbi:MAG TPA: polysaccharide biosynthesis C-terminal domain-containing protein, partial [Chitinophagaceae bacterium]|nr:polysaccharide biosynthesis C-terminal domain-containing protein [Chitinophagaceae bacterium]